MSKIWWLSLIHSTLPSFCVSGGESWQMLRHTAPTLYHSLLQDVDDVAERELPVVHSRIEWDEEKLTRLDSLNRHLKRQLPCLCPGQHRLKEPTTLSSRSIRHAASCPQLTSLPAASLKNTPNPCWRARNASGQCGLASFPCAACLVSNHDHNVNPRPNQ